MTDRSPLSLEAVRREHCSTTSFMKNDAEGNPIIPCCAKCSYGSGDARFGALFVAFPCEAVVQAERAEALRVLCEDAVKALKAFADATFFEDDEDRAPTFDLVEDLSARLAALSEGAE